MARQFRATLVLTPGLAAASTGITAKITTHDPALAAALAGIAALAVLLALLLVLRAELHKLQTKSCEQLTQSAVQKEHFRRVTSSWFLWWLFPKHAKARQEAAAAYKPVVFKSGATNKQVSVARVEDTTTVSSADTESGVMPQQTSLAAKNGSPRRRNYQTSKRRSHRSDTQDGMSSSKNSEQ